MTHDRTKRRGWMRRAACAAVAVTGFVSFATPAFAARIVQVRVGNHPTFSRVVFQLDTHAGYRIESTDAGRELSVTIDASSRDRDITSKSLGVGSVSIEAAGDKAIARVSLKRSDLLVKEMILSNPPRIVLDFEYPASKVAAATSQAATSTPTATPTPPVRIATPTPASKPATARPEPPARDRTAKPAASEQIAKPTPKPARPMPEPAASSGGGAVERTPVPEPVVAQAPVAPAPKPAMPKPDPERIEGPTVAKTPQPEVPTREPSALSAVPKSDAANADLIAGMEAAVAKAGSAADTAPIAPSTTPERTGIARPKPAPRTPAAKPRAAGVEPARTAPAQPESETNWMLLAGVGAAVLVVAIVALMLVRRRAIPNDLDVTELAAQQADAGPDADAELRDRIPSGGFEMQGSRKPNEATEWVAPVQPRDESASDEPTVLVSEENTAAYSLSEVSANAAEPAAGLFDDDSEGEKAMDMEVSDLPAERAEFAAAPRSRVSAGSDSELGSMVQELMTRLGTLETRLEESNDARERLERQVAAQSEELRVQRAAIARTQRALRSLSRTDEEQATEPALREPSA